MQTTLVPIHKLTVSPRNVRRTEAPIADLVASITAHGLLNPLTVIGSDNDTFEVIAGSRRLRALQQLSIDQVPVILRSDMAPEELSLTENISRQPMTTLDILLALRTITSAIEEPGFIAERFGIPMDRARKIARLSCLAPEVLDAWQADEIQAGEAEAFAATADHDAQRTALERYRITESSWERSPQKIRQWLGHGDYDMKRLLAYVGRETYEAQGGGIETDLFGGGERVLDPELLQQLADTKRKTAADEVQAQCNRPVELIAERPDNYWQHNIHPERGDLSAPEEARLLELETLMESLDRDEDEEAFDATEAEYDALNEKRPIILPEGGKIGLHIYEQGIDFYWLVRPDAAPTAESEQAEAAEVTESVTPTHTASMTMQVMRRERLIARSAASKKLADSALQLLVFTVCRGCFSPTSYRHGIDGLSLIQSDCDAMNERTFITIADQDKAWATFKRAFNTPDKLSRLAAEVLGRLTQSHAAPDAAQVALLTNLTTSLAWESTLEFWQMWRKGQMLELVKEFDPSGDVNNLISNMNQNEMRAALNDLFTKRERIMWKGLDEATLAAIASWVPKWLRFTDEEMAEAEAPAEVEPEERTDD